MTILNRYSTFDAFALNFGEHYIDGVLQPFAGLKHLYIKRTTEILLELKESFL